MSKPIRGKTDTFEYIVQDHQAHQKMDLVLLHGFGADCTDLFGLYSFFTSLPIRRFIFPNGVMPANGVPTGRAWFPIDVSALEQAMMTGSYRDMGARELPEAVGNLSKRIEQSLVEELKVDPKNTIIGGFSQGAMMATNIMLNSDHNYKALINLSGTFLDRKNWTAKIKQKAAAKTPIFVSHGSNDALLNPQDADALAKTFYEEQYPLTYESFTGGHEIPMEVIQSINSFVTKLK